MANQVLMILLMKGDALSAGRTNEKRFRGNPTSSSDATTAPSATTTDPASELNEITKSPTLANAVPADPSLSDTAALSRIHSDLKQKDELIAALVHELEQAVEQLDRFERCGTDRSHSDLPNPLINQPRESIGAQSGLASELRQMAEEWEQSRPGDALSRIESELASVHELLRSLQHDERRRPEPIHESEYSRPSISEVPSAHPDEVVNMTLDESSPSWDSIKSSLFNVEAPQLSAEDCQGESELLRLMSETPTPAEIKFETAGLDELKTAIVERDAYIIQLNRLFRTRNTLALPTDWATLGQVPADLQIRVESLIEHLDVQVRLGEVEMSLERAKLTRERSQIQSDREEIEKHMRRLGLTSLADLDNISAAGGSANERRWMRFLGPNKK